MTDEPRLPRPRLRVTTRPLVAGEVAPADTVPEMPAAAPVRAPLWPRLVRVSKRAAVILGALSAILGGVYAVARITVASERKEADMHDTITIVRSMAERLSRIEGRLEVLINLSRHKESP